MMRGTPRKTYRFEHHVGSTILGAAEPHVEPLMADAKGLMQLALHAESFGSWHLDVATGQSRWSPRVYRIHGLEPEDGLVDLEAAVRLYNAQDAKSVAWLVKKAILQQIGYEFVMRLNRPDGVQRLVQSIAAVSVDADGNTTALYGLFRDVTDRMNAHDLSVSRARLVRSMISNSPAPIAIVDRNMAYLDVSPSWLDYHRLPNRDEVIGRSHYVVNSGVPDEWKAQHAEAMAGKVIRRDETLRTRADSRSPAAGSTVFPWRLASGEVGGLVLMIRVTNTGAEQKTTLDQIENLLSE